MVGDLCFDADMAGTFDFFSGVVRDLWLYSGVAGNGSGRAPPPLVAAQRSSLRMKLFFRPCGL